MTTAVRRQNIYALPSGGPRTESGKARSSQNSLRHGLTAKQAVIAGEDQGEFNELHENLISDQKPSGELEFQLVGEIAACLWRLARARRHESQIFEVSMDLYGDKGPKLELVMRYITSIERQLQRTIVRLERLQAERRDVESNQVEKIDPPKVMTAGCSSVSASARQFVSQSSDTSRSTDEFVPQNAESQPDPVSTVRFAS